MKPSLKAPLLLVVCAVGALCAGRSALAQDVAKVRLRFTPAAGSVLKKTFDQHHGLVMRDSQLIDGDKQMAVEQIELATRTLIVCSDEYVTVGPERPLVFRRKHDQIAFVAEASIGMQAERLDTLNGHGALGDHEVVFTWIPEESEYGRHYRGPESEEAYLPGLVADANLAGLLPEREVRVGDEWSIPPSRLRDVLAPAGEQPIRYERTASILLARTLVMGVGGGLWEAFEAEPTGTFTGRLERVREENGRRLAEITLKIDVHCEVDQTQLANDLRNSIELCAGMSVAEARLTLDLQGEGQLVWDVDAGLPEVLQVVCEEEVISEHRQAERTSDIPILHPVSESKRLHLGGALRVDVTFERK